MSVLTIESLSKYFLDEYSKIVLPSGPEKRIGAFVQLPQRFEEISKDMKYIQEQIEIKNATEQKVIEWISNYSLEFCSMLFAGGAAPKIWQHWAGIYALILILAKKIHEATIFALLAGEWDLIKVLPEAPLTFFSTIDNVTMDYKKADLLVFWKLVDGKPEADLSKIKNEDSYDQAWLDLSISIPQKDYQKTDDALKKIAEFWRGESENDNDWNGYHNAQYPDFEPLPCAAIILARRNGYQPKTLTREQLLFFAPGFTAEKTETLFPKIFSIS